VEALRLAMLEGQHTLSKVGARLEARGRISLLPPGFQGISRHDDRLGQSREARFAAPRHRVCGAIALNALAVSTLSPSWRPQETTTLPL
jgi:hypothetical protein